MNINFNLQTFEAFVLISFELKDGVISPANLKTLKPPDPVQQHFAHKGVVLSGRGPIWLYGYLVHYYHPTKWVATYDPRLQAAVVVESHDPATQVGDLITIKKQ